MNNVLSEQDSQCFLDFFLRAYGLNILNHQLDNMQSAINSACQYYQFSEPSELLQKITQEPLCPERIMLIEKITIDESYFFRDDIQIDFLRTRILPNLIKEKRELGDKSLRIWSAGCSTGQEIYTITILLHQLLPDYASWNLHLIGTDINHQSLNRAMQAEFNEWNIRTGREFIDESGYFKPIEGSRYQLKAEIKDNVKFSYLNLAENSYPSIMDGTCALDLILCRNVFIYFNQPTIQAACTRFSEALNGGGILMLSVADPMQLECENFALKQIDDVFFFEKHWGGDVVGEEINAVQANYSTTEVNVAPMIVQSTIADKPLSLEACKQEIIPLLSAANWPGALSLVRKHLESYEQDAELYQFKAKCLVNLGQIFEAKIACEQSILYDSVEPHTYLLYGLILIQLGLLADAEKAFRQTIFLNNAFMEAHYQLGQLLLKKGQKSMAIKSIQNALDLAAEEAPDRPIHNVIPLTYSHFSDVMRNELEVLKKSQSYS